MAGEDKGAAAAAPAAEEVVEAPKAKHGWVKHLATGTFHEVDDLDLTLTAYPGQYEKTDKPGDRSTKIGWPEPKDDEPAA